MLFKNLIIKIFFKKNLNNKEKIKSILKSYKRIYKLFLFLDFSLNYTKYFLFHMIC